MIVAGQFIDFLLPYMEDGRSIPSAEQASRIFDEADRLVAEGAVGAAIIYSANYGQTQDIVKAYDAGQATVTLTGANQAQVMIAMEDGLASTHKHLQGKLRIAPISTMNGYGSQRLEPWDDAVHMAILKADLARIEEWLKAGWTILGWQNQDTVKSSTHPYAVGGKIANMPAKIDAYIQQTLIGLAKTY